MLYNNQLSQELFDALQDIPLMDMHTHLTGGKLGARGLHDILLYHMAISDLYAAGCPDGARLTEYPGWPDDQEAFERIQRTLPYLRHCWNTSIFWGIRVILNDLYGWDAPITEDNWQALDHKIRERADDRNWHREILKKANIAGVSSEWGRREDGADDDILNYALEWGFFTRCQWGEFDTSLYELERCWGKTPATPTPIGTGPRPEPERVIRTVDDIHEAIEYYVATIPWRQVIATATHISTDIDLSPVTEDEVAEALGKREQAGERERNIYASYINEAFLTAIEEHEGQIVFQFSFGAEPLPFETGSRLSQKSIAQMGAMITRHPRLRFMCFLASRHANQSLCTLCRELPNLSLTGYWWHNFFPSCIRQIMEERLDMLPANKQIGFFSDAYCVEWSYGKAYLVRKQLAEVLAGKIMQGQYTTEEAILLAKSICYETPQRLLNMRSITD